MSYWAIRDPKRRAEAKTIYEENHPTIDVTPKRIGLDGRNVAVLDISNRVVAMWQCATRIEQAVATELARAGCDSSLWSRFTAAEDCEGYLYLVARDSRQHWEVPIDSIVLARAVYKVAVQITNPVESEAATSDDQAITPAAQEEAKENEDQ